MASIYDLIPRSATTNPTRTNQLIGNKAAHAYYGNCDVTESEITEPAKLFQDNLKGLKITNWNVQCPTYKTDQLWKLVYKQRDQPNILGITETWLSDKYDDSFINMPGYHNPPQRKDRTCIAHVGVIIYINDRYDYDRTDDLEVRYIETI